MAAHDHEHGGGGIAPLERKMTLAGVLFLTLSAATPASSMFVIVPDVIRQAGTGALGAMLAAALVSSVVATVYGELGSAFPNAGGEYAIVSRVLGRIPGFAMLAVNLANLLLATAVLSLGLADYVRAIWPGVGVLPTALAAVAAATVLGVLNIRTNAWITGLFLLVELGALGLVAALGFSHPERGAGALLLHPVRAVAHGALSPASFATVVLGATVALFAYDGYGSALYFAEELQAPRRRMARAVALALVLTVTSELLPLAAVLTGAPDLKTLLSDASPFVSFVAARVGAGAARVLSLAVALAIFNAVVALVLLSARQLYATGRDGVWGARVDAALVRTHPRWRSPWPATLVAGVTAAALCLLPLQFLLVLTGTGITAIYAGLCVALLVGRGTGATAGAYRRGRWLPWLAGATLMVLAGVLVSDLMDPEGLPSLVATAVIGGLGAIAGWRVGGSGRWSTTAPADDAVAG